MISPSGARSVSRSVAAMALVVLLVALALPVHGQIPLYDAEGVPRMDGDDLILEDVVGDAAPFGVQTGDGLPSGAATSHVDIDYVRFGSETVSAFQIEFSFTDWHGEATQAGRVLGLGGVYCYGEFRFNEDPLFRYSYYFSLNVLVPGQDPTLSYHYFDRYEDSGEYGRRENLAPYVDITLDQDASSVVYTLDKQGALAGKDRAPVSKSDALTGFEVRCRTSGFFYSFGDAVYAGPDGAFPFKSNGAGDVVQVGFGQPVRTEVAELGDRAYERQVGGPVPVVSLAPDEPTIIDFHLINKQDRKRIVSLAASATGADGAVLAGWNLSAAPHVELSADETRALKMIVTPPAGVALGDSVTLRVDVSVLSEDAPGTALQTARIVPVLGPEHNQIRFHADVVGAGPAETGLFPDAYFRDAELGWSLLADDPAWTDETVGFAPFSGDWWELPPISVSREVRFDPEGTFELVLDLTSDQPARVSIDFAVGSERTGDWWYSWDRYDVGTEPIKIRRSVEDDLSRLTAGDAIMGSILISSNIDLAAAGGLRFDPTGSSLTLPLLEVVEQELVVSDGRFVPTLALASSQDAEAYMNPGKTYTFDLVLANEGIEPDDLTVQVDLGNASASGWRAEVVPGRSFHVPAGNATRFGVQVYAPGGAGEGEVAEIVVEAISKHDTLAKSKLRLGVFVAQQIDIEERFYEADDNQIAPLAEIEESSMLPLWPLVLLALALRRRRAASPGSAKAP